MSKQLHQVLKQIRKTNKKSYRLPYFENYPYVCALNTSVYNYWKGGKKCIAKKRLKLGSDVFHLTIGYSYQNQKSLIITITKNEIIITPASYHCLDTLIFQGKEMSNEDYFNLSITYPDIPSPHDIEVLRKEMMNKRTRFNDISITFGYTYD